jgi:hypothetical protein
MASQSWVSLLNPASPQASGAGVVLNTAATQTLSPVTGSSADVAQVQPAGQPYGWYAGLLIRVTAQGYLTTTGTSGTLTFSLAARVANTGSTWVTLATTAAITTGTGSLVGCPWNVSGIIRCSAVPAASGTLATQGSINIYPVSAQTLGTGSADISMGMPNASGETSATVDTTQLQGISLRCAQVTSACTVQLTEWLAEALD